MVLASILGMSISLVPCFMFGLIMMISFLLCNCEYIGETVAKHFCAWKNRRKARLKSSSGSKIERRRSRQGSFSSSNDGTNPYRKVQPSSVESAIVRSSSINLSIINYENNFMTNATAPVFDEDENSEQGEEGSLLAISNGESDPPPSYEECLQERKMRKRKSE